MISKGWGGRTSDQFITKNSNFLENIQYGDGIKADRGLSIVETLRTFGTELEIPSFTKGQSQLQPEEVEDKRNIANIRIHVEHVIGNLQKKYLILSGTIPIDFLMTNNDQKVTALDKIIHTSCTLINLCPLVVHWNRMCSLKSFCGKFDILTFTFVNLERVFLSKMCLKLNLFL